MTHNKMLDRDPSVVITSNRNELKVYQGNVIYLNNGDNFELRFFNPLQEKIGVEINFNGLKKGDGYLILNPGQDLTLDRFLDDQRKMVFETYSINGNSKEAREAIEQNGKIKFKFYKESNWYNNYHNEINVNYDFPPKPKKYDNDWSGVKSNSGSVGTRGVYYGATLDSFSDNTTSNISTSQSMNMGSITNTSTFNSPGVFTTETDNSTIETGRVERGEHSKQELKEVNVNFESSAFFTVEYQIMPHSAKNYNISEIRQYCTCCGYRLRKQSWKFCPKCGEEIQ